MIRHRKWFFLWILIPIVAVGAFILLSINYLINPALYRNVLQKSLTMTIGREVSIGRARINLWGGAGIAFEDFRVKDRSQAFDLLQCKRLILKAKIFPFLKREVKWKRIVLDQPAIHVIKDKNGRLNILDGPLTPEGVKASQQKVVQTLSTLLGASLTIREGEIFFSDESLSDSPLVTEIRRFNLQFSNASDRNLFLFRLNGKIIHSQKEGHFSIVGSLENIFENLDLSSGKVNAKVEARGMEIFHFWPYLKTLLPMKTISGTFDLSARYRGDFRGAFKTSAKIKFKEVTFDYPQVFSYLLKPKWINIDFDADFDLKNLKVPRLFIEMPEIWVKANGKIYGIGSKEMGLEAEARSSPFDLSEGRRFIPYRIITANVSGPLYRAEGSGPVQIISVKLAGKIPEIDHCDQPGNAHALSVELKLAGVRLKLPWNFPLLEELKGSLLFRGGHLNLKEMEGRIFHSRLENVNAIFFELLLIPTLQAQCEGRFDLMDLPHLLKTEIFPDSFSETLSSLNILSGSVDYHLSVRGALKQPFHFQHQGVYHFSKTRLTHRQIPFPILIWEGRIEISNNDLQWSGVRVEFGHSSLLMSGQWKHGGKPHPLEIAARGRVDLKNLFALFQTSLFPEEIRSKTKGIESLSGMGQLSFKGESLPKAPHFSYGAEFLPREVSLFQKGIPFPLVFKEGTLSFSNLGIGFSKTKVLFGSSSLTLDGSVQEGKFSLSTVGSIDLKLLHLLLQSSLFPDQMRSLMGEIQGLAGGAEVRLKWLGRMEEWTKALREGEVRLKGVSFRHQEIPVPFSNMEGSILLSPEKIQLNGLRGRLGDSPITVSGVLSRFSSLSPGLSQRGEDFRFAGSRRLLSFHIFSPQLDLDPLFPRREGTTPTSFEKIRDWLSNWSLNGKVEVELGKYRNLHYRDLKGEMKTVDGKLFLDPFQLKGDGGDLWGKGWIEPAERGVRFEIEPRLSNMEAKAFLQTLFRKGEEERILVSGRLYLENVELRGEGEDFQKVKESLNGRLRLEIENGVIERFNILSKIFSLLNVSQLFSGRLPDLVTRGLPYHQITANIHIKDGIASTEDFLVDSDAMKITLVGKVDVGKNLIDAKIGIHPLVTLDTVLSRVPIAGYILTGKDKAFLSYIYEVEGDLDDPKIKALPIKSISEGFFGIIKRLLETPLRPFQKSHSSK
jgi:uncharacterized protein involved in outer membrane biogenesis